MQLQTKPVAHPEQSAAAPGALVRRLIAHVSQVFLGKESAVTQAVLTLVSGGHVLVEDVPGVGKTLLARALAQSLEARFKRIQFTADLLPSDVTGVTVYSPERREFHFRKGPVFTQVLLGDEINRATPRTQSSLLEAMEELSVTVDGERHVLEAPFFVIATQNPIELEGTYPLPFAQMDRFMTRLRIGYLDRREEVRMLEAQQVALPLEQLQPVLDCPALERLKAAVRQVRVEADLRGYIVDVIQATRRAEALDHGASPRGSLDTQTYAQAVALLAGRDFVLPDDIKEAARRVLPHRLIGRKGQRTGAFQPEAVIEEIVRTTPVPV